MQNVGTLLGAAIRPNTTEDEFPAFHADEGKGGFYSVPDIAARNAIFNDRRVIGMRVKVISEDKDYELVGGITNADWVEKVYGTPIDFATQAENEAAATATDIATINNAKATTPRGLRWFWNSLRAIAWSWSGKQSFFGGVNMGSLTASRWLRLNGDKDIESFDGQALLDGKVDKADLVITSGTNITTDANWSGRLLKINNGSSDISITVNHAITFAGVKEGSGNIQFVSGSVTVTPVDGLSLLSGNIGSTFGVSKRESTSNAINLFITNR